MSRDIAGMLAGEGLDVGSWSNGPGDRYAAHAHAYDKVLVCARGSIVFGLPDTGASIQLETGDRLQLPAGTRHDAAGGPDGVTCLEAHLEAGSIAILRRLPARSWRDAGGRASATGDHTETVSAREA